MFKPNWRSWVEKEQVLILKVHRKIVQCYSDWYYYFCILELKYQTLLYKYQ